MARKIVDYQVDRFIDFEDILDLYKEGFLEVEIPQDLRGRESEVQKFAKECIEFIEDNWEDSKANFQFEDVDLDFVAYTKNIVILIV